MLESQDYKCRICGAPHGEKKGRRLNVDHEHSTNKTRELICVGCNRLAGNFEFDVERLYKVYQYLKRHESVALARLELMLRERNENA